ncbi:uncharacterized protein EAF01_007815 [Botrytis porri]|uniref:uncharacterized protein n=1 Tax=Botrytis porri TaxID=87229 RepID=UPI0018FF9BBB|nr:uncharacterized protein EAF01_007815 [Botrytis porri]KAF7900513.1 hypothetical protein EAF01_007815 [Botrytis porri]
MQDLVLCGIPKGMVPGPTVGHRDPASRHHCHIRLVLVTIEDFMAMKYKMQNTTQEIMYLEPIKMGANLVS